MYRKQIHAKLLAYLGQAMLSTFQAVYQEARHSTPILTNAANIAVSAGF